MVVLELSLQLLIFLAFCLKPDFSENSTSIDVLSNFDNTHKVANYDVQIGFTTSDRKSPENFSFFGFLVPKDEKFYKLSNKKYKFSIQ